MSILLWANPAGGLGRVMTVGKPTGSEYGYRDAAAGTPYGDLSPTSFEGDTIILWRGTATDVIQVQFASFGQPSGLAQIQVIFEEFGESPPMPFGTQNYFVSWPGINAFLASKNGQGLTCDLRGLP